MVGFGTLPDGRVSVSSSGGSGTLPDGRTFKGPQELKTILKTRKDEFSRCLTEKMMTYALGRGLEYYDTEVRVFGLQAVHGLKFDGLLWGTSHMHFRSCDKLKNLTFCFEPHTISARPNLRDGL